MADQSKRISVRLSASAHRALLRRATAAGKSESTIVREALDAHLASAGKAQTAYDLVKKLRLAGVARNLPTDLSTSRAYFKGFGR